jgi:hypothetical protein
MKSLSIVGRDTHTEEHVVCYYTAGDRMKHWGGEEHFGAGYGDCFSDRVCSSYRDSGRFSPPAQS